MTKIISMYLILKVANKRVSYGHSTRGTLGTTGNIKNEKNIIINNSTDDS